MSIEENKAIVRKWVRLWNVGDAEGIASLYAAENFSWEISGQSPVSKVYSRNEILAVIEQVFNRPMKQPHHIEIRNITAENDRVALEFIGTATFDDGTEFRNFYHTLFFLHDAKIAQGRAYLDTWIAAGSPMRTDDGAGADGAGAPNSRR